MIEIRIAVFRGQVQRKSFQQEHSFFPQEVKEKSAELQVGRHS